MSMLWLRFRRFLHCLFHMHRAETLWVSGKVVWLGCDDCDRVFFMDKEKLGPDFIRTKVKLAKLSRNNRGGR